MPETSCAQCREALIWYAAGQLDPAKHARVARHLAGCADCRAELAQWRNVATVFAADDGLPPDRDADATWKHLLAHLPPSPHPANNGSYTTRGFNDMPFDAPAMIRPPTPTPREPKTTSKRQRAFLAPVAALLLVIIGATVFTVLRPHHMTKVATASTATNVAADLGTPIDTSHPLPAGVAIDPKTGLPQDMALQKVQMIAANNGWAVGAIMPVSTANNTTYHPPVSSLILHYDGTTWQPIGVAISQSLLTDIAMLPSGDGWAVGLTYTIATGQPTPTVTPIILHAVAGHWYRVTTPSSLYLTNVAGITAAEAWGIGESYSATAPHHTAVVVAHYTQGTWSVAATFPSNDPINQLSLTLASPSEGWAGIGDQLLRFHDGEWTMWPTQLQGYVNGLQALSPTDAWAVGGITQSTANGFIAHFDGATWKTVAVPAQNDRTTLNAIAMTSPTDGWAIGNTAHEADLLPAVLLHYNNGMWSNVAAPHDGDLNSLAMLSPTEGWIVGASTHHSGGHATALILHYLHGTWSVYGG